MEHVFRVAEVGPSVLNAPSRETKFPLNSLVDALIDGNWVPAKVYSKSYVVKKPNGDITSMNTLKSGVEFLYHEYSVLVNCEEGNFRRVFDNPANVEIRDPTLICPSQMQPQRNRRQNTQNKKSLNKGTDGSRLGAFRAKGPTAAKKTLLQTVFNDLTIRQYDKNYHIEDNEGKNCITFYYLNAESIYIKDLDKCSLNTTGPKLLTKIEEFARLANIKHISLQDESSVQSCRIDICLYYLYILCTGQSWYNKHGYKSNNHEVELKHNREFINSPMIEYIKKDDKNYITLSNILNPDAEEPDVKGTVQEVFQQLKHYLSIADNIVNRPDKCSDRNTIKNIEFIQNLIKDIGIKHIKYNKRMLSKELTSLANGGTKRKRNNLKETLVSRAVEPSVPPKKSRRRRSKSKK
jgi:hypothetical protein